MHVDVWRHYITRVFVLKSMFILINIYGRFLLTNNRANHNNQKQYNSLVLSPRPRILHIIIAYVSLASFTSYGVRNQVKFRQPNDFGEFLWHMYQLKLRKKGRSINQQYHPIPGVLEIIEIRGGVSEFKATNQYQQHVGSVHLLKSQVQEKKRIHT